MMGPPEYAAYLQAATSVVGLPATNITHIIKYFDGVHDAIILELMVAQSLREPAADNTLSGDDSLEIARNIIDGLALPCAGKLSAQWSAVLTGVSAPDLSAQVVEVWPGGDGGQIESAHVMAHALVEYLMLVMLVDFDTGDMLVDLDDIILYKPTDCDSGDNTFLYVFGGIAIMAIVLSIVMFLRRRNRGVKLDTIINATV